MARQDDCPRCGAPRFSTDPEPHLCKNLRDRLARQTEAIAMIEATIRRGIKTGYSIEAIAEQVYRVMSGRDLP